jgi:predicted transcriptional regulator
MIDDAIFLSVKPKYAERILSGEKTVELRRNRPRVADGSLVVLYVSSPVKAVLGAFYVDRIVAASPEALWPLVEQESGLTREEYDAYYAGAAQGVGIFVRSAHSIQIPYQLAELRRDLPHFHPPQAFRYLRSLGEFAETLLKRIGWTPERTFAGD